jgi:hypothetical protein
MNRKKRGLTTTRSTEHKQVLLRDTGKMLKLKTGLKAGGGKGGAIGETIG